MSTPPLAADDWVCSDLVDCVVEDARWEDCALSRLSTEAAHAVLSFLGLAPEEYSLCLLACDDARIAVLNTEFRGKEQPTNVLSWPAYDLRPAGPGLRPPPLQADPLGGDTTELGDIALAYETCLSEAQAAGKLFADHIRHLVIHAVLHLLGYDHQSEADAALMEGIEIATLEKLAIANPYIR